MDLIDYERLIQSEELARRHIASFCWPAGGPFCPRCRNTKVYMLYDDRMRCSSCKYTFHDLSGRWINAGRLTSRDWIRQLKLFELELTIHKMASQLRQAYNTIYKAVTTIRMALLAQALDGSRILMSPLGREIGFDGTRATLRTTHSPMQTIPVFGIIKRSDWVFIDILHHMEAETVFHFNVNFGLKLERMGNIIYTDRYQRYDALVLCGDQRLPYDYIRQRKKRALVDVQLSGFWKFAKPRLQRFNGISPHRFPLYLKELEFRYNHRRDNLFPLMLESLCAFVPRVEQ